MTFELLCGVLACGGESYLEANAHKVLAATIGVSFLTAAFFVRQQRHYTGGRGHAFEVVVDPPQTPPSESARSPLTPAR